MQQRLHAIQDRIRRAGANRPQGDSVRLVAVSKFQEVTAMQGLYQAGQRVFGENYVQELVAKSLLMPEDVEWHMIGHLQRNKVRQLAGRVSWIHTVDSYVLAHEISNRWGALGAQPCQVLLQVNIANEASKSGVAPEQLMALARSVAVLPGITVRGLMTIPPMDNDPEASRPYYREMRRLAKHMHEAAIPGISMTELSMGMSDDFEVAIEEGATMVRIGSALFGARPV